jgi:methionyl-tRNA formyltransferase
MAGGNIHGRMLVDEMVRAECPPALVINEVGSARAGKLERFLENDFDNPPPLSAFGVEVAEVAAYDSEETFEMLASRDPKFLVNGGCGIFLRRLLEAATPLNVHPGLLPAFRGLDPVLWSVFRKAPVGATVHVMSEGIDEGPILIARPMPWRGATSLLKLRLQCMRWGASLLAEYLADPARFPPRVQSKSEGEYFGAFPADQLPVATMNLRAYVPSQGTGASCR